MADDLLLSVKDVGLKLGTNQILNGLSFDVRDRARPGVVTGQLIGMLGPSGVGKTKLLRLISGLDKPDRGSILGKDGKPLAVGSVGYVLQNYLLLRHRTVLDNLLVAADLNGLSKAAAKEKADVLLSRFGLADRASFYPAQLSGGQRQRVAIAQQLIRNQQFLLMDEPFSGLDPVALDEVMSFIVEVANMDELNTVIVVTHDIRAATMVADTLLLLGRDRDADDKVVPGARIQHTYDLVERNLAYRAGIELMSDFTSLERELKSQFKRL